MAKRRSFLPILFKLALLAVGITGQVVTFGGRNFMSSSALLYFTNQSNIWIMLIALVFLIYDLLRLFRGEAAPTPGKLLHSLRFMCTVAITLTFLVFSLLLSPQMIRMGQEKYLLSLGNICVHNLVPIFAITDWCAADSPSVFSKRSFLLGAILPLAYCIFALALSFTGAHFGGSKVPYFFFNYDLNGWFSLGGGRLGVVWWILLLAAAVLLMSRGLMAVNELRLRRRAARVSKIIS